MPKRKPTKSRSAPSGQANTLNTPTILIIEDDSFLANMYQTKLELEGFKTLVAQDGEKGLSMIRKYQPDLVLLDIILPKLNGFELMKQLKRNKKLSQIPIILLTNLSQKEDVQKGLDLGAKDYLIKAHYMPSEVIAKIRKFVYPPSPLRSY